MSASGLSYEDTAQVLERLGSIATEVVLIGGQAVHFWVSHYADRDPLLSDGVPFTSKDIDFCGTREQVKAAAVALEGEFKLSNRFDDATPSTGVVTYKDQSGEEQKIDFLDLPYGIRQADLDDMSLTVATGIGDVEFRVLPPILCMECRICNTSLPGYTSEHALRQLRASIVCARESLIDIAQQEGARAFFVAAERVFWFARGRSKGRREPRDVYDRYGIDPFDAVPRGLPIPELEAFYSKRLPQMLRILAWDRAGRRRAAEIRAAQRRK